MAATLDPMSPPDPSAAPLRWETEDGLPRRITTADGTTWVTAATDPAPRLVLHLPDHREVVVALDAATHPVLGPCDAIERPDGTRLALGSRTDWRRPERIPALDRPGALPRGAGTALLNLLAWQAHRAETGPLRYHGPYPTDALFDSLSASFDVDGDPSAARDRFVADGEARALAGSHGEIDVDFHPRPHAWSWPAPRVCVQRRDERIERVYVDGRAFDRDGRSPRRLVERDDALVALIALGPEPLCERVRLSQAGIPLADPRPLPPCPESLRDIPLPTPVTHVLGEVLLAQAPRLLRPAMQSTLASTPIRWGDPGPELIAWRDDGLILHASMVPVLPTDPTALLGVLVQLLEPPLRRAAARVLDEAWPVP